MLLYVFELLKVSLNQRAPPPTSGIESACFLKRIPASGLYVSSLFLYLPHLLTIIFLFLLLLCECDVQYIVIDTIDLLLTLSSGNWQLLLYRYYDGSDNVISFTEV